MFLKVLHEYCHLMYVTKVKIVFGLGSSPHLFKNERAHWIRRLRWRAKQRSDILTQMVM